jgi:hypothetical protein
MTRLPTSVEWASSVWNNSSSSLNSTWTTVGGCYPSPTTQSAGTTSLPIPIRSVLNIQFRFPFAVCGIAMTSLVRELLLDNLLKNHFWNTFEQKPSLDAYHQVYCEHPCTDY